MSGPKAGRQTISLPSTMDSVSELESIVEKLATDAGLDEDDVFRVTMASREAAVAFPDVPPIDAAVVGIVDGHQVRDFRGRGTEKEC